MSYSKDLSRRLRHKKPMTGFFNTLTPEQKRMALAYDGPDTIGPDFKVVVPPHPDKYPKHKGHKGSVFGGICNRTACSSAYAEYYNRGTYGYYCMPCARGINGRDLNPICIHVDHDLTHEEMKQQTQLMYEGMRPARGGS